MPSRTRINPATGETVSADTTTTTTATDTTVDNSVQLDEMEENAVSTGEDTPLLDGLDQELEEEVYLGPEKAGDLEKVTLSPGSTYKITAADMEAWDPWKVIARDHGMSPEDLQAFNQQIIELEGSGPAMGGPVSLEVGAEIYLPSAQELGFAEVRKHTSSYDEALTLWGEMEEGPNVRILDAARSAASGEVGESIGTKGVDGGWFYTANPTLAGARRSRSKMVNGVREYKVFWIPDFWKCSLFMHDVVWRAGYQPHQRDNDHYELAGRLNESKHYEEIDVRNARPGDCWQRFGGRGSDESHNAILTSFVDIEEVDSEHERWTFDILGAEDERAAESERSHVVKKGTSEIAEGYKAGKLLRFFRPRAERSPTEG